jgi:hypothetical protein
MRYWLYILVPMAIAVYFFENPQQFTALMHWIERLVR